MGPIPGAPDERPSALKSRPLGFVEVGPEPDDEPVVRAPIAAATKSPAPTPVVMRPVEQATPVGEWAIPGGNGNGNGNGKGNGNGGVVPGDIGDPTPTRRWTPEERGEAHAQSELEPLAPILEPKRKPDPEPVDGDDEDAIFDVATARGPSASAVASAAGFDQARDTEPPIVPRAPRPPAPPEEPERTPVVVRNREIPAGDLEAPSAPSLEPEPLSDTATEPAKKKRGFFRTAASWGVRAGLALVAFGGGFVYIEYRSMQAELPPLDRIKNYRPPVVTEVRAADGTMIGKFYEEERYVVSLEEIPDHVKKAFLASEDAGFYEHSGVDFKSIARAVFKNVAAGKKAQGGSTISQQVARTFFLSPKKTIKRKLSEILLARQIEKELTKDQILHRYLNQIFFGKGAYGIEAASRIHFGKSVKDLTLAEGALLAGLPQAPSRYAPQTAPEEAKRRRSYVLREMLNNGWITEAERAAADQEELKLGTIADPTKTLAPFVTEQIRRDLVKLLGHDVVYQEGLSVTATVDLKRQKAAEEAIRIGRYRLDRRIGYRGAPEKIDLKTTPIGDAARALAGPAPVNAGDESKAIVEEVGSERAYVRLPGGALGVLHRLDNLWAYPVAPELYFKPRKAEDLTRVLKPGDVIAVKVVDPAESAGRKAALAPPKKGAPPDPKIVKKLDGRLTLALQQEPDVEGALLSYSLPEGRVLAMVGGSDYAKSEYLIPMQAHRQVGSTFKTIVYAAALSKKPPPGTPKEKRADFRFTLASILQDKPIVMKAHEAELKSLRKRRMSDEDEEQWKPGNSGDKYYGDTMLRSAYILSRNVPTIELAQKVGIKEILSFAKKLGIESKLEGDLSIALGSGALTLDEITRAHAVFPAGGRKVKPYFVEHVVDRDGQVLFDLQTSLDAVEEEPVIDPKVAFVMTQLMVDVARMGTSVEAAKQLKRPSGGKTGTTNDYVDAWYVGFTPDMITSVWVGYDQVRSLGVGETGAEAALPIWIDYMKVATEGTPAKGFTPPEGVVKLKIDRTSGKLARRDQKPEEIVETWFVKGTEPTEQASVGKIKDEPNIFEIDPGLR